MVKEIFTSADNFYSAFQFLATYLRPMDHGCRMGCNFSQYSNKNWFAIRGRQTNHSAFQLDWENVQHVFEFRWLNHLLVTSWASTIYTQRPKNGGHPFKRAAVVKYVIGLSHLKLSRVYVKRRSHLLSMLANTPTSRELTYETSSWTLEHIGTTMHINYSSDRYQPNGTPQSLTAPANHSCFHTKLIITCMNCLAIARLYTWSMTFRAYGSSTNRVLWLIILSRTVGCESWTIPGCKIASHTVLASDSCCNVEGIS